ncbi:hypothetical protein VNO77_17002 [Canavalia gladiata]|uniref:VQ domain-containing protein n=1 Tax=Canavalia gladiata TaxID=3824 RepID=A0AAN9LI55_CANGL
MDTISNSVMSSVQQRTTPPKRNKPKKKNTTKPFKVVYISNPMKIKTSASHFRALVQELTGQDAESPPDPSRFHAAADESLQLLDSDDSSSKNENDDHLKCVVPPPLDPGKPSSIQTFEPLDDDVFTPQMIDSISALLPASVFYQSPHLDQW